MKLRNGQVVISSCCALLCASLASAQGGRGGGDWTTSGNDAQRSSWVRTDAKISKAAMEKPGFAFLWKQKLANDARQLNSLTSAVLMERYIGYRGFRSLGYVGGSSDNVIALDTDLGRVEWKKRLEGAPPPPNASLACPGGMTTPLARPTGAAFPMMGGGGRAGGRGGPAKSDVGAPGEGAVTIQAAAANAAGRGGNARGALPGALPGAAGAPGAPAARAGGGQQRMPSLVYALSSDGKLHGMYVSNGEEPAAAIQFLPANANASGLILVDNVAYVATSNGCGNAPNGVWALDMASKQVTSWKAKGNIAGATGPAFGGDGTIYAATDTGEVVSLEPKTLKVLATYNGGTGFASSPVVFEHNEKALLAVAGKDGSLHLLPSTLGTALAKTPAANPVTDAAGALASWQDADGSRWLLAPGASTVAAWKVVDKNGAPTLEQGWTSRDMATPLTPMVVNGVVFALSSGEYRGKDTAMTASQRAQRSGKAVLYALDGKTGKELWNSGTTITSFVHSGGLSAGGSQMYLQTYDGTLYAFGFPIEH